MEQILDYIKQNSHRLFKHSENDILEALFDNNGFFFDSQTALIYTNIRNLPHLYVAYSTSENGFYYIGKSFQNGGRWKRSHAYHLGTLAHHLFDTLNQYDQNHQHWIDNWMQIETLNLGNNNHSIKLSSEVKICFIPFDLYQQHLYPDFVYPIDQNDKVGIRKINTQVERQLINFLNQENYNLLNIQNI